MRRVLVRLLNWRHKREYGRLGKHKPTCRKAILKDIEYQMAILLSDIDKQIAEHIRQDKHLRHSETVSELDWLVEWLWELCYEGKISDREYHNLSNSLIEK